MLKRGEQVTKTHLERKTTFSFFWKKKKKRRGPKIVGALYIQIESLVLQNLLPSLGRKIQNPQLSWRAGGIGIFLHNL